MSNPESDVVMSMSKRVACEGISGALGHPKTYLDMGEETQVRCKYCDRLFKLDPKAKAAHH